MRVDRVLRWGICAALLVGVVLFVSSSLKTGTGPGNHRVSVIVPQATDVLAGQYVRDAGVNVGTVQSIEAVDGGRAAKLVFNLDDKVWPLTKGATLTLREGGTASFVNRYINLVKGPASAAPIAQDGVLPAADFHVPVEFDSFLSTFTPTVRTSLKQFLNNSGIALKSAEPGLIQSIEKAPAALTQVDAVLDDLDSNESALSELITDGSKVVSSVNASNPGVESLISNAATTFSALDTRTKQIASTLHALPGSLNQLHATLVTATPVLQEAKEVTGKLSTGVDQIDDDATPLNSVLVTLKHVGPDAVSALKSVHEAVPSLNPLLTRVTSLSPTLQSIGSQAVTALKCVRPYTPDIVAFTSDWGDFLSGTNGKDHYFRATAQAEIPAADTAENYNSAQLHKTYPFVAYAYPPPPGYAAGQPWLLPSCNEGASTLNPDDDPEINTSASELPVSTSSTASHR